MSHGEAENVGEVHGLSRRFGRTLALDGVDLKIPRGAVFGLVGENGAGKTTLIKHILGLLKAQSGTVRVFGRDPVLDPVGVLGRVGYLSEDRDLPDWMTVGELIRKPARVAVGMVQKRVIAQGWLGSTPEGPYAKLKARSPEV
jgi:ABC-type multidrug transport system ATPase subunit